MSRWMICLLPICLSGSNLFAPSAFGGVPAFPGAEGYGTQTVHARGRPVFRVTRLDDEDLMQDLEYLKPGQFRWALAKARAAGGGYIVFDVAGTVKLRRTAEIPSNCCIAGHSAPGGGIAIEGAPLWIGEWAGAGVHDVVIRHIRFRGRGPAGSDAFNVIRPDSGNIVFDHVSVSYFRDGAVDIVEGAHDVTMQWSHFGDAASSGTNEVYHCEPHLVAKKANRLSMHHNVYTHGHSRMPLVNSDALQIRCEFSNNVVYNFRKYPSDFQSPGGLTNVIGNVYVPGPNTHGDVGGPRPVITGGRGCTLHVKDNYSLAGMGHNNMDSNGVVFPGSDQHVLRGKPLWVAGTRASDKVAETAVMGVGGKIGPKPGTLNYSPTRFADMPVITYQPALKSASQVLGRFGALPRDKTDTRLQREVLRHEGFWKLDIPNDGNNYTAGWDSSVIRDRDADGMPDTWEASKLKGNLAPNGHELDPVYDNIEVYLSERAAELLKQTTDADVAGLLNFPKTGQ